MSYQSILKGLILSFFLLFVFVSFMKPVTGPDAMWHLKTGEYISTHKIIPETDPFSFATDEVPFLGKFILSQYWLGQVVFYKIYETFGLFGLVVLRAGIFTLIIVLLWSLIRQKGFYLSLLITGGTALTLLRPFSELRAQVFTFLFTVCLIFLLEKYREKGFSKLSLLLPPVMLIWANMHGGYIYGIVVIVIYIVAEWVGISRKDSSMISGEEKAFKQNFYNFFALCIFSVLLSFANPNTYEAFLYTFQTHSPTLFAAVAEYQTPFEVMKNDQDQFIYAYWVFLALSSIMIVAFILKRNVASLLLVLFSGVMTLTAIRYIPLFALTAVSTVRHLPIRLKLHVPHKFSYSIAVFVLIVLAFVTTRMAPFRDENLFQFNDSLIYPVKAAHFMTEEGINGNIYVSYNKSPYILFSQYPASRVYFDSRFINKERVALAMKINGEVDSLEEHIRTFNALIPQNIGSLIIHVEDKKISSSEKEEFIENQKWKVLLNQIGAEIIVHEALNLYTGRIYPLVLRLIRADDWRLIYLDGNVLVFVKNIDKFKDIIARYEKPKTFVYDEIISEGLRGINNDNAEFHSSVALALLLKGNTHDNTKFIIEQALYLQPANNTATYCAALYSLMISKTMNVEGAKESPSP